MESGETFSPMVVRCEQMEPVGLESLMYEAESG